MVTMSPCKTGWSVGCGIAAAARRLEREDSLVNVGLTREETSPGWVSRPRAGFFLLHSIPGMLLFGLAPFALLRHWTLDVA